MENVLHLLRMKSWLIFCHEKEIVKNQCFCQISKTHHQKRSPSCKYNSDILLLLSEDAFHPSLKTHKLKGSLEGSWACSVGYDLRIVFEFVDDEGWEAVLLETIGTHDEVY